MTWTRRLIDAVRPPTATARPKPGRILNPRPEDAWRDYPSSNLTPSRLMSVLREADAGSLSAPMQLYEEMEEKDAPEVSAPAPAEGEVAPAEGEAPVDAEKKAEEAESDPK